MESPIFFCFPFKGHICYRKGLKITRRPVEAIKKENVYPLKKKVSKREIKKLKPVEYPCKNCWTLAPNLTFV